MGRFPAAQPAAVPAAAGTSSPAPWVGTPEFTPPADLVYVDPWPEALAKVRESIEEIVDSNAKRFVAVFSPFMSPEEAYPSLYLKGIDTQHHLGIGACACCRH
ncbi:MAG: hypothetical protein U0892_11290 [Pirellulales bacterium]